ncbi:MAG TPA: transglutaminase family protein, partial [Polyangiaceae bacterium]|nr:transglutaminase family protein [Polyangiaceae bacterium]
NQAHHFTIAAFHDRVVILAGATVETHPKLVALAEAADKLPLADLNPRFQDFLGFLGPVQRDSRLVQFAEQVGLFRCTRAADAILLVTTRLRDRLEYKKGVTSSTTTVSDALDLGQGVCQDFSHVGLALLRMVGIPARYVSGYLYRETPRELETHAWCEAYLPSLGWVGVDPTHGELAGEGHVAVAVGRSYADVPPNRGVYRGDAEERISVKVTMNRLDDDLASLAPFSPGSFDVPSFRDGPVQAERKLNLRQLEQQQQQQQQ